MPHARASSAIGVELGSSFDRGRGGPGGWWIVDEPESHLGEDILVPVLAGWRRGTMPEFPDSAYCTVAPDCAGLGMRGALVLDPQDRPSRKTPDLCARECPALVVC